MSDLAEKILAAIEAKEDAAVFDDERRRCAADREIVELYKATLVACDVSAATILAGAVRVRLGAYEKVIILLARGYGIQP